MCVHIHIHIYMYDPGEQRVRATWPRPHSYRLILKAEWKEKRETPQLEVPGMEPPPAHTTTCGQLIFLRRLCEMKAPTSSCNRVTLLAIYKKFQQDTDPDEALLGTSHTDCGPWANL